MLVAKIEIWPYGAHDRAANICTLYIANRGITNSLPGDNGDACEYETWISLDERVPMRAPEEGVARFRHVRQEGATECVQRALAALKEIANDG